MKIISLADETIVKIAKNVKKSVDKKNRMFVRDSNAFAE